MNRAMAEAALSLVGTPFRLHGRSTATGLDCVGVVAEAMRRAGYEADIPQGYSLRSVDLARWLGHAKRSQLTAVDGDGDVVLCRTNPVQPHLLVCVADGFVHAHAGLGKVTYLQGALPWPAVMQWRLAAKETEQSWQRSYFQP